jgi:hypothetical protein
VEKSTKSGSDESSQQPFTTTIMTEQPPTTDKMGGVKTESHTAHPSKNELPTPWETLREKEIRINTENLTRAISYVLDDRGVVARLRAQGVLRRAGCSQFLRAMHGEIVTSSTKDLISFVAFVEEVAANLKKYCQKTEQGYDTMLSERWEQEIMAVMKTW